MDYRGFAAENCVYATSALRLTCCRPTYVGRKEEERCYRECREFLRNHERTNRIELDETYTRYKISYSAIGNETNEIKPHHETLETWITYLKKQSTA